jgi:hypothetical protein
MAIIDSRCFSAGKGGAVVSRNSFLTAAQFGEQLRRIDFVLVAQ